MRPRDAAGRRPEPPRSFSGAGSPPQAGSWRPSVIGILIRAARDLWHESFLLMVFNFVFAVSAMPGFLLLSYGLSRRELLLGALGVLALGAWPLTTFGLFQAAADAVAGRPIHLRTFVDGGLRRLGLAYRWGALNLAVTGLLVVNAFFYLDPQAPFFGTWAGSFLGALFLMACVAWVISQTGLLAVLATLEVGSLRRAWVEWRQVVRRRPGTVLGIGLVGAGLLMAGVIVIPLGLLLAFATTAVLVCRMVSDICLGPPVEVAQRGKGT